MKKFLSIILIVLLAVCCFSGCEKQPQETPISDFEYKKISGFNSEEHIQIEKYLGNDKVVIIPSRIEDLPVIVIADFAFLDKDLEEIQFPDTLIEIMGDAFKNCDSLKSVILPSHLERIGSKAFADCDSLEKVFIPKSIKKLGHGAFGNNPSLIEVEFEDGIETIPGLYAFLNCDALKTITIPKGVEKLGDVIFENCGSLESVTFLGDAPNKVGEVPFGSNMDITVYYNSSANGWDNTELDMYNLEEID